MRGVNCTPVSDPALPPAYDHPLWEAWDMAVDYCLAQLPGVFNDNEEFRSCPFFDDQVGKGETRPRLARASSACLPCLSSRRDVSHHPCGTAHCLSGVARHERQQHRGPPGAAAYCSPGPSQPDPPVRSWRKEKRRWWLNKRRGEQRHKRKKASPPNGAMRSRRPRVADSRLGSLSAPPTLNAPDPQPPRTPPLPPQAARPAAAGPLSRHGPVGCPKIAVRRHLPLRSKAAGRAGTRCLAGEAGLQPANETGAGLATPCLIRSQLSARLPFSVVTRT